MLHNMAVQRKKIVFFFNFHSLPCRDVVVEDCLQTLDYTIYRLHDCYVYRRQGILMKKSGISLRMGDIESNLKSSKFVLLFTE